jgi:hypothetical protein
MTKPSASPRAAAPILVVLLLGMVVEASPAASQQHVAAQRLQEWVRFLRLVDYEPVGNARYGKTGPGRTVGHTFNAAAGHRYVVIMTSPSARGPRAERRCSRYWRCSPWRWG